MRARTSQNLSLRGPPPSSTDLCACKLTEQQLKRGNVFSLWAFLTLNNVERHFLTVGQAAASATVDCSEMYKHIRAVVLFDKTVTLFIVKPFNDTGKQLT